ncbi:MAG: hypothetical protein EB101_08660 [Chitinophagia bacterium]|nr:hypothetical protein [Chitinophagia bacterium]
MDRIDLLINTLKQQHQQKESPDVLLQTVRELQAELTAAGAGQTLHLGTAKIAVMMPATAASPSPATPAAPAPTAAAPADPVSTTPVSVNDRMAEEQPMRADTLSREPIKELKKAIGINDRFLLIQELFEGDEKRFEQAIRTLDSFSILAEASFWIEREVKGKPGYQKDSPAAVLLDQLVSRRFS